MLQAENIRSARCSQSKLFLPARARKKIAVLGMLTNACKDHYLGKNSIDYPIYRPKSEMVSKKRNTQLPEILLTYKNQVLIKRLSSLGLVI